MNNKVVLVNIRDEVLAEYDKLKAHKEGLLHRAFSVFIFNSQGKLYLQKRASHKYHSANLWTNTCCSHPNLNDDIEKNAITRLKEEMGMEVSKLYFLDKILYYVEFDNGMKEHELDYVFIGFSDDEPKINKEEVQEWKILSLEEIKENVRQNPENFTFWFKLLLPKFEGLNIKEYVI